MQAFKFSNGEYGAHKVVCVHNGRSYSVWFNASNKLTDAEPSGGGYVKPGGKIWQALERKWFGIKSAADKAWAETAASYIGDGTWYTT